MSDPILCHRCPGFVMEDDGEWFACPCCKSRTKGRERQQAEHQAHMEELGMNEEEYHEHCMSFINTEPLPDELLEHLVQRLADEWQPACVHDTVNPFLPVTP